MRHQQFILNEKGEPVPVPDLFAWSTWLVSGNTQVCETFVGAVRVSTIFLGLDFCSYEGPPVLWETMVFGGALDHLGDRCAGAREQAEAMHAKMVERVKEAECKSI